MNFIPQSVLNGVLKADYVLLFQVAVFHLEFSKERMPSQAQQHLVPHSR